MRKLLLIFLVLLILAIGADVLARRTAEDQVAQRLQKKLSLSSEPSVSMSGLPFLVDLLRGEIEVVEMTGDQIRSEDMTIDEIEVEMREVHFSVADVIDGSGRINVRSGDGQATVTQSDLNAALAGVGAPFTVDLTSDGLVAASDGGEVQGDIALDGGSLSVSGEGLPTVPLDLPSLGGIVRFESVALADGRVTIALTISRMSLQA
jgi:LmeA-like phospholipid-binding